MHYWNAIRGNVNLAEMLPTRRRSTGHTLEHHHVRKINIFKKNLNFNYQHISKGHVVDWCTCLSTCVRSELSMPRAVTDNNDGKLK